MVKVDDEDFKPVKRRANVRGRKVARQVALLKVELRALIKASGVSEAVIAARLGRAPAYFTNLFVTRPGRNPSAVEMGLLFEVFDELGVSVATFFQRFERSWRQVEARAKTSSPAAATRRRTPQGALDRLKKLQGPEATAPELARRAADGGRRQIARNVKRRKPPHSSNP